MNWELVWDALCVTIAIGGGIAAVCLVIEIAYYIGKYCINSLTLTCAAIFLAVWALIYTGMITI